MTPAQTLVEENARLRAEIELLKKSQRIVIVNGRTTREIPIEDLAALKFASREVQP